MNRFFELPCELKRYIYEYDDTFKEKHKDSIALLNFLYDSYDEKIVYAVIPDNDDEEVEIATYIPVKKIAKYNEYVLNYCKRKRTLRSYKSLVKQ